MIESETVVTKMAQSVESDGLRRPSILAYTARFARSHYLQDASIRPHKPFSAGWPTHTVSNMPIVCMAGVLARIACQFCPDAAIPTLSAGLGSSKPAFMWFLSL